VGLLKNLKMLKLDYTSVDDKGVESLKKLSQLEELSMDTTGITDEGAKLLATMKSLKRLNIYHTFVTEKAMKELQAALPDCNIVYDRDSSQPNRRPK
jgi:hypothetical protein